MNEENASYLKTGLYYMGFSDNLFPELISQIGKNENEFQLTESRTFNNKEVDYVLDFKRSDRENSENYFWNGYTATFKDNTERSLDVEVRQNAGFTAKEAANLLTGLAVCKGNKNAAKVKNEVWSELDFEHKNEQGQFVMNRYYNNHGFDMQAALEALPIKIENDNELPDWIARSVRKGNLPEVTITQNGEEQKVFLMANPKERSIDVFDEGGNMIIRQQGLSAQQQEKETRATKKTPLKQDAVLQKLLDKTPRKPVPALAGEDGPEQKKGRKR